MLWKRENGDWSSVLHSEGIWRREAWNLAGWNWTQRRGTKTVNKMLGKNKEFKLSFKKQMKKDIINRSQTAEGLGHVKGNREGKGTSYRIRGQSNLILIFRLPWQFVHYKCIYWITYLLEVANFLNSVLSPVKSGTTEKQEYLRSGQLLYDTFSTS